MLKLHHVQLQLNIGLHAFLRPSRLQLAFNSLNIYTSEKYAEQKL
jgi:hypothetical protein